MYEIQRSKTLTKHEYIYIYIYIYIYAKHWLKLNKKINGKCCFNSIQILCLAMQCLHVDKILMVVKIIIYVNPHSLNVIILLPLDKI